MWSINGALALWLGYWVFMGWVVWTYERKNRELKMENERLKRAVASGVGRAAKRDVVSTNSTRYSDGNKVKRNSENLGKNGTDLNKS